MPKPYIIDKTLQSTSSWSGGETTELFIHPMDSNYMDLDFDVRISTASVAVEESTYTSLPNIERTLILLKGSLQLIHKNHHKSNLKPFDADYFSGDWETHSRGRVVNFNIMTGNSAKSKHEILHMTRADDFHVKTKHKFTCFYLAAGALNTNSGSMYSGNMLVAPNQCHIEIKPTEDSTVIRINIELG